MQPCWAWVTSFEVYVTRSGEMSRKSHRTNFELQAKEMKNVSFGRIWGFHKNEFNKPSSSDPSAPNIN